MQTGARPAPSDNSASVHAQSLADVEKASVREGDFRDEREALAWLRYELATAQQKL